MQFRDGVHSARAMHVRYAYAKAPLLSGNFDLATRNLVGTLIEFNEYYSMVHDFGCCGALCTCNARARNGSSHFGNL